MKIKGLTVVFIIAVISFFLSLVFFLWLDRNDENQISTSTSSYDTVFVEVAPSVSPFLIVKTPELQPIITPRPTPTEEPTAELTAAPTSTPVPTPAPTPKPTPAPTTNPWRSLGTFTLTAYCPCQSCSGGYGHATATGAHATEGITVAVDPKVIPYGSRLLINGHEYIAQDCGGSVKGNIVDIFFESHNSVNAFGRKTAEVFIKR